MDRQVPDMIMYFIGGTVFGFSFGYLVGRVDSIHALLRGPESTSFVSSVSRDQKQQRKKVSIDEAKYVTDVSTETMVPSGQPLGIVTKSNDDIASASNKLAQLKKMKG